MDFSWQYMPYLLDAFRVGVFFLEIWVFVKGGCFFQTTIPNLYALKNNIWCLFLRLKFYSFSQITCVIIILPLTSTLIPLSSVQTLGWTFWYLFLLHLVRCQQKFQAEGKRLSSFRKSERFWYCFCRSLWIKIRKGTWQFHAICISAWTHNGNFSIQIHMAELQLEPIPQSK